MFYTWNFAEKIACSEKEKEEAGASGAVIGAIISNVNERSAYLFSQEPGLALSLDDEDIRKAQQMFLSIKDKVLPGT